MAFHMQDSVTAASRYAQLKTDRDPFLNTARECAALTIPSLVPPEGWKGQMLPQPYQSTGAEGVTNLSAKVTLVLFPPGGSFYRYSIDDFVKDRLAAVADDPAAAMAEFEDALGKMERSVTTRMEQTGARAVEYESVLHLIVTGNALIHVGPKSKLKFFPLSRYVVKRDTDGNVLEIIVLETVARSALPPALREKVAEHEKMNPTSQQDQTEQKSLDLYTWVRRNETGAWDVHQECCGMPIEGTDGSYPADKCPWLPLRWNRVSGEDYGRGRCEEFLGDLRSYDTACKSIIDFSAVVSKILLLVNESGTTRKDRLAKARSGDVIDGNPKDAAFLMVEKGQDFNVLAKVADDLKNRIERGFLMFSSVQRNAERVTAEEIRLMAGELEAGLGGVYTLLAQEFQLPLVTCITHQMTLAGDLPSLPKGAVSPQIVTGVDGLGRSADLQRLDALIAGLGQQFGQEAVARYVNVGAYARRRATSLGINVDGLIRTDDELAQADQQAQMADMTKAALPQGVKAISDNMLAAQQAEAPAAA